MATMKTLNGYGFNATEFNGKTSDSYLQKTDTASDTSKLGGKAPEYYLQPRNLLDNSDFTNPVNQRERTSYTAYGYTIDRWKNSHSFQVSVNAGSITVAGAKSYHHFMQAIEKYSFLVGKTVTLAIRCKGASGGTAGLAMIDSSGTVYGNTQHTLTGGWQTIVETVTIPGEISTTSLWFSVYTASALDMEWAALYEGFYTADTLPPYVPKGYAAELAECQRYYYRMNLKSAPCLGSGWAYKTNNRIPITLPMTMRITPTVQMDVVSNFQIIYNNATYNATDINIQNCTFNHLTLNVVADTGIPDWDIVSSRIKDTAIIEFLADL